MPEPYVHISSMWHGSAVRDAGLSSCPEPASRSDVAWCVRRGALSGDARQFEIRADWGCGPSPVMTRIVAREDAVARPLENRRLGGNRASNDYALRVGSRGHGLPRSPQSRFGGAPCVQSLAATLLLSADWGRAVALRTSTQGAPLQRGCRARGPRGNPSDVTGIACPGTGRRRGRQRQAQPGNRSRPMVRRIVALAARYLPLLAVVAVFMGPVVPAASA